MSPEESLIEALLSLIAATRPPETDNAARIRTLEAELAVAYETVSRLIAQKRALQRRLDADLTVGSMAIKR